MKRKKTGYSTEQVVAIHACHTSLCIIGMISEELSEVDESSRSPLVDSASKVMSALQPQLVELIERFREEIRQVH